MFGGVEDVHINFVDDLKCNNDVMNHKQLKILTITVEMKKGSVLFFSTRIGCIQ